MENFTTTAHPDIPSEPCETNNFVYTIVLFGGSCCIITLLTLLERRSNKDKCGCFGGHPGLLIPVNLLDHNTDRISFAAAFGSMASECFSLFESGDFFPSAPGWSKTLLVMALVAYCGLMYYPLFACLSTNWTFVGNFIGAVFSMCIFVSYLTTILHCTRTTNESLPGVDFAIQLPIFVCLGFLFLRFSWKFCHHSYLTIKNRRIPKQVDRALSESHHTTYVKNLLCTGPYTTFADISFVQNLKGLLNKETKAEVWKHVTSMIYKNDPTFKYSPKIIAVFAVAIICIYQFSIIIIFLVNWINNYLQLLSDSQTNTNEVFFQYSSALKVFIGSTICALIISLAFTLWTAFQILTSYRIILKSLFKGEFKAVHFKRSEFNAHTTVSYSLSYAGSQIAYLLWGYIISFTVLLLGCVLIAYVVILPIIGDIPFSIFKYVGLNILIPVIIMFLFMRIQMLYSRRLIQRIDTVGDAGQPTKKGVLALNNRKVYHIVTFFLFLFYIVLGLFGCLMTIVKGIVLGIVYLARLDRCRLMSGFESHDRAYLYFISFMYVEEAHRHPVLLVFCDLLLDKHRTKKNIRLDEFASNTGSPFSTVCLDTTSTSSGRSLPTLPRARLRWLKAYTLIRNPSLVVIRCEKVESQNGFSNELTSKNSVV